MINFCVAKLRNSRAQAYLTRACILRLELDHFQSQIDLPSFNQRLPCIKIKQGEEVAVDYKILQVEFLLFYVVADIFK